MKSAQVLAAENKELLERVEQLERELGSESSTTANAYNALIEGIYGKLSEHLINAETAQFLGYLAVDLYRAYRKELGMNINGDEMQ